MSEKINTDIVCVKNIFCCSVFFNYLLILSVWNITPTFTDCFIIQFEKSRNMLMHQHLHCYILLLSLISKIFLDFLRNTCLSLSFHSVYFVLDGAFCRYFQRGSYKNIFILHQSSKINTHFFADNFHISCSDLFKCWQFTFNSALIWYMKIIWWHLTDKPGFMWNFRNFNSVIFRNEKLPLQCVENRPAYEPLACLSSK